MNETTGVRPWQWVVTVIVIIILIVLGYYLFSGSKSSTTTDDQQPTETPSTTTAAATNRVVVSDQFPGNIVYLSSVQLAQSGWVVIHKDNAGTPGKVIGSAWFEKGINPGQVKLSENTVEGGVYYAVLHTDDGDKVFNEAKDLPVKDSLGNVIMKMFRASATATEVKG